jgi:molybdopterin-guanine dinucleotide biosynthesis protein A
MLSIPLLNGLVLAGGLSSRMGSDKSLIDYHGKPQRERLFEMLKGVCVEVYTSCRGEQHVPMALNPLIDMMSIKSPLNGILTAFHACPDRAWLAVAVDLPHVSSDVLKEIASLRDASKLATCFFDSSAGAPEPLLTIWEPAARPLIIANAEAGNVSPRSFLQHHDVHMVYGMNESVFLNVNDPAARDRWKGNNSLES